MTKHDRKRVHEAIEKVVDLILGYAEVWGAGPTEKLCQFFSKAVSWVSNFGTGGIEANAKDHVFGGPVITRTHD